MTNNYDEHRLGAKLQEVRSTKTQLIRRKTRSLFAGGLLIFITFFMVWWLIEYPLILEPEGTYWDDYLIAVLLAVIRGLVAIFLGLLGVMFFYWGITIKPSEAILYETGFVYTHGRKTVKVAFQDVAGTLFLAERSIPSGRSRISIMMYWSRLVKKGEEEIDIDDCQAEFQDFRQLFQALDTNFSNYLLKDITPENLRCQTISFGDDLTLRNGQFIYETEDDEVTFSLADVAYAEHPEKPREHDVLRLIDANTQTLATVRLDEMLNIQALYRIIEMAKAYQ